MGYVFDPQRLHEIARLGMGKPHAEMCQVVIDELARAYPGYIETKQDWFFNLTAGAVGMMTVLHGSFTEYLILFGTSIGTEAFSGRYRLDIYDYMLTGEMWTYTEQRFSEKVISRPGDMALLHKGQAKGYRFLEDTWVLEYGRGFVATSLPLGLGDATFSGQDIPTIYKTLRNYGRLVFRSLVHGKI